MQSKHKGEIVLSLTIGTLIVVGLLTTLSVIGNKLTQKKVITTNASTIDQCDDPNWFCEGICAEPNIRAMFGYDYLKWRGEREKEVGGKCPLTGTTISPTVTPNPNYSSLAQEEYNRCLAMGTPEWFCADECADPINVRNVFKSVYNDKTDAEVATLWRIEKLDNINAGKADADKITCDLINVPTPNYPSSTPRAPSPTPTRISSPTPRASSPTPTKAPSPTPPIAQLCQIRCSNDSFCQANCGSKYFCNLDTNYCQVKPADCTSNNGVIYQYNSTICEKTGTSFMQWECTSSGNKFLKYCDACSPDRKTCLTSTPTPPLIPTPSPTSTKCDPNWNCSGVCADQNTRNIFGNNSEKWRVQKCIIPTRSAITSTPVPTKSPNAPTPTIPLTRCNLLMGNGNQSKLDIVILADGYKDMSLFLSDAQKVPPALRKTNLGSLLNKMNVWVFQDISQAHSFSTGENDASRECGGDIALILRDSEEFFGGAISRTIVINNSTLILIDYVVGHELAHAVVGISDEYDYKKNAPPNDNVPRANCSSVSNASGNPNLPCPKWASRFPNVGCTKVCGYSNFYRPYNGLGQDSIMSCSGSYDFNQPSLIDGWEPALKNY